MTRFALAEIAELKGNSFRKLVINGVCPFDEFQEQIRFEGNLAHQLKNVLNIMERISNGKLVSGDKFKNITLRGDHRKEYEIKTRDLRIYAFQAGGFVVVTAGKKSTQKKDILKFRAIKQAYLKSTP